MLAIASLQSMVRPRGLPSPLRLRVILAFVAIVAVAGLGAAALLLSRAAEEQEAIGQQAQVNALAISDAFDQEVAAVNYLLKGLSTSPALQSGDMKAFYDQLKATPVPEGSWFVFNDLAFLVGCMGLSAEEPSLPSASGLMGPTVR
jgi:two-component system, NarL family, sensor kinase